MWYSLRDADRAKGKWVKVGTVDASKQKKVFPKKAEIPTISSFFGLGWPSTVPTDPWYPRGFFFIQPQAHGIAVSASRMLGPEAVSGRFLEL